MAAQANREREKREAAMLAMTTVTRMRRDGFNVLEPAALGILRLLILLSTLAGYAESIRY